MSRGEVAGSDTAPHRGRTRHRMSEEREQMSVVELAELDEVKGLLAKGQQVGVLSYAEITKAMSELDLDEADVEEVHGYLLALGQQALHLIQLLELYH